MKSNNLSLLICIILLFIGFPLSYLVFLKYQLWAIIFYGVWVFLIFKLQELLFKIFCKIFKE
jgi:uncharacterized membrane protein YbjE (DUF340 family)